MAIDLRFGHGIGIGPAATNCVMTRGMRQGVKCVTALLAAAVIIVRSEGPAPAHAPQPSPSAEASPVNGGPAGDELLLTSYGRRASSYAPLPASYRAAAYGSGHLAGTGSGA